MAQPVQSVAVPRELMAKLWLALVLAAGMGTQTAQGQDLIAPRSCADRAGLRSPRGTEAVKLSFTNASPQDVLLWWVDESGSMKLLSTLVVGKTIQYDTQRDHVFLVYGANGRCAAVYSAALRNGAVRLTAAIAALASPPPALPRRPATAAPPTAVALPTTGARPATTVEQPPEQLRRIVFSLSYHFAALSGDPAGPGGRATSLSSLLQRFGAAPDLRQAHEAWRSAALSGRVDVPDLAAAQSHAFDRQVEAMPPEHIVYANLGRLAAALEYAFRDQADRASLVASARAEAGTSPLMSEVAEELDLRSALEREEASALLRESIFESAQWCREDAARGVCSVGIAATYERMAALLDVDPAQPSEGLRLVQQVLGSLLVQ